MGRKLVRPSDDAATGVSGPGDAVNISWGDGF